MHMNAASNRRLADCQGEVDRLRNEFHQFMWTTAHELRNPAQTVLGLSEMIEVEDLPDPIGQVLVNIRRDAARLAGVVDDLYFRAEIEAGTLHVNRVRFSLNELLEELFSTVERMYPDHVEMQYGPLPLVYADADHVRKILFNLLLNALRCSGVEDGRLVRLAASVETIRQNVDISVGDLAPRIPPEYCDTLFEPSAELPVELGRPRFGLGLGLYAGRFIARKMGGDLSISRVDGESPGNVFVLSLPVAEAP
jgi:signal transduction histidine kinase